MINLGISIVVAVFCTVITYALYYLAEYEYWPTISKKLFSTTTKYAIFQFVTYSIILIFIYSVIYRVPIFRIDGLGNQIYIILI